jgi:GntR family transcriptional regulator
MVSDQYQIAPKIFEQNLNQIQFLCDILPQGSSQEVYGFEWVETPVKVAAALRITPGSESLFTSWRMSFHDEPISYGETYLQPEAGQHVTIADAETGCIYKIIEESLEISISDMEQRIYAIAAKIDVAVMLDVAEGTPVLTVERILKTNDGQPLGYERNYYRADRFMFHVTTSKIKNEACF